MSTSSLKEQGPLSSISATARRQPEGEEGEGWEEREVPVVRFVSLLC